MTNIQKWLIVIAVWVIAISMLLGSFRGKYQPYPGGGYAINTWTGTSYHIKELRKK